MNRLKNLIVRILASVIPPLLILFVDPETASLTLAAVSGILLVFLGWFVLMSLGGLIPNFYVGDGKEIFNTWMRRSTLLSIIIVCVVLFHQIWFSIYDLGLRLNLGLKVLSSVFWFLISMGLTYAIKLPEREKQKIRLRDKPEDEEELNADTAEALEEQHRQQGADG